MGRLRTNFQYGTLGASLTASGTTITFAVAPGFPTVASPDIVAITLEPGTTNQEIVWLTTYTATQTTGTISRGQEGTTGVAHGPGPVIWSHDPTVVDFYPSAMKAAVVATSQTTASTTYADLATVGPSVTVNTLTTAWVEVGAQITNSGANYSLMSVAVSGATTLAANNANMAEWNAAAGAFTAYTFGSLITGLTPGANTFTAKYQVAAGTGTFANRNIKVTPLDV